MLEEKKITAYRLSKESGLVYATVSSLVKDKQKGINFKTLDAICRTLKCQPGELFIFEEEENLEKE